jgi:hypothetical protein
MSTLSLRLPNSLHKQLRELAKKEGISINQLVSVAVAEKLSALMTEDYLTNRAARGDRTAYDAVLDRVPDREVPNTDRLDPD